MVLLSAPVIISTVVFLAMVGVVGFLAWGERNKYLEDKRAASGAGESGPSAGQAPEIDPDTGTETEG